MKSFIVYPIAFAVFTAKPYGLSGRKYRAEAEAHVLVDYLSRIPEALLRSCHQRRNTVPTRRLLARYCASTTYESCPC